MARYNHFKESPYKRISFKSLNNGELFRVAKHNGRKIIYVLCEKIDCFSYKEIENNITRKLFSDLFDVYIFS